MDPDTLDQQAAAMRAGANDDPEVEAAASDLQNTARLQRTQQQREQAEEEAREREEANEERQREAEQDKDIV